MENYLIQFIVVVISGCLGYLLGVVKEFREKKQNVYEEILPVILKVAYHPEDTDEAEFGKALSKLWLYANKKVTKKMDNVVSILHDNQRGDKTKSIQEAVAEMRKDIQISFWQEIKPKDVNHLYSRIGT